MENTNSIFILPYKSRRRFWSKRRALSVQCNATPSRLAAALFNIINQDNAAYNDIVIRNSTVSNNIASQGGGGSRMTFIAYQSRIHNNTISTVECLFSENVASWGGGVTFLTTKEQYVTEPSNRVYYNDTVWSRNSAQIGSAIDLTIFHPLLKGEVVNVQLSRCTFSENSNWSCVF